MCFKDDKIMPCFCLVQEFLTFCYTFIVRQIFNRWGYFFRNLPQFCFVLKRIYSNRMALCAINEVLFGKSTPSVWPNSKTMFQLKR